MAEGAAGQQVSNFSASGALYIPKWSDEEPHWCMYGVPGEPQSAGACAEWYRTEQMAATYDVLVELQDS